MACIKLRSATVEYRDGISILSIRDEVSVGEEDALAIIDAVSEVSMRVGPLLVRLGDGHSINFGAQRILARADNVDLIAVVATTGAANMVVKYLVDFFALFNSRFKMRIFHQEEPAWHWLKSQKPELTTEEIGRERN